MGINVHLGLRHSWLRRAGPQSSGSRRLRAKRARGSRVFSWKVSARTLRLERAAAVRDHVCRRLSSNVPGKAMPSELKARLSSSSMAGIGSRACRPCTCSVSARCGRRTSAAGRLVEYRSRDGAGVTPGPEHIARRAPRRCVAFAATRDGCQRLADGDAAAMYDASASSGRSAVLPRAAAGPRPNCPNAPVCGARK